MCAMIFDRVDVLLQMLSSKKKDYVVCEKFFTRKKRRGGGINYFKLSFLSIEQKISMVRDHYENKKQAYCNEVICGSIAKRK